MVGLFLFCFLEGTVAKDKEPIATSSVMKEVQGTVSNMSGRYLTISYKQDEEKGVEYEIVLFLDETIKVKRKKSLDEINLGDLVSVQYEEITEEYTDGEKRKRRARIITFIKPAEKEGELRSMER